MEDIFQKIDYCFRLLRWNYEEKLVEPPKFFYLIASALRDASDFTATIFFYFLLPFTKDMGVDRVILSHIVILLFDRLKKIESYIGNVISLYSILYKILQNIILEIHDRLLSQSKQIILEYASHLELKSINLTPDTPGYDISLQFKALFEYYIQLQTKIKSVNLILSQSQKCKVSQLLTGLDRVSNNLCTYNEIFEVFKKIFEENSNAVSRT